MATAARPPRTGKRPPPASRPHNPDRVPAPAPHHPWPLWPAESRSQSSARPSPCKHSAAHAPSLARRTRPRRSAFRLMRHVRLAHGLIGQREDSVPLLRILLRRMMPGEKSVIGIKRRVQQIQAVEFLKHDRIQQQRRCLRVPRMLLVKLLEARHRSRKVQLVEMHVGFANQRIAVQWVGANLARPSGNGTRQRHHEQPRRPRSTTPALPVNVSPRYPVGLNAPWMIFRDEIASSPCLPVLAVRALERNPSLLIFTLRERKVRQPFTLCTVRSFMGQLRPLPRVRRAVSAVDRPTEGENRMNRKDVLRLLVNQAQSNGFEFRRWFQKNIETAWPGTEQALATLATEGRYFALVFSHDFVQFVLENWSAHQLQRALHHLPACQQQGRGPPRHPQAFHAPHQSSPTSGNTICARWPRATIPSLTFAASFPRRTSHLCMTSVIPPDAA